MANKEIPAVIKAREEFEDVDLVFPWRTPFKITRELHGLYQPWYVKHEGEDIRVTVSEI